MQLVHSLQVKHELACTTPVCIMVLTKYTQAKLPNLHIPHTLIMDQSSLFSVSTGVYGLNFTIPIFLLDSS